MSTLRSIPRIVIAGTGSSVGKTTVAVGLIQALQNRGLKVVSFKCGPDYLDPSYHAKVSGKACHNLDSWMMGKESLISFFLETSQDFDMAVIEGVMGLFDGASPTSDIGSTAEIAKWLKAPVFLVVDVQGMARTLAAIAKGFAEFDPELKVEGIMANFVGSQGHFSLLKTALSEFPLVGGLPRTSDQAFPSRHLGLQSARFDRLLDARIKAWGDLAEEWFNLDLILQIAKNCESLEPPMGFHLRANGHGQSKKLCKIGIAFDEAFHFYYDYNLRLLESAGAELIYFSPIREKRLPRVDGLYIGGGYPELHAEALSSNEELLKEIREFGRNGFLVYAECGGLIYLSEEVTTSTGKAFPMVGLISGKVKMEAKLKALGYVEVSTESPTVLGDKGLRFRGHQFRYSDIEVDKDVWHSYRVHSRRGKESFLEGYSFRNILASYIHAHWASNLQIAHNFIKSCVRNHERV